MGDLWRSKKMTLAQLVVQNDAAHKLLTHLGHLGLFHLRDLNAGTSLHKRAFVDEVRQADDLKRILHDLHLELQRANIHPAPVEPVLPPLDKIEPKLRELETELQTLKASTALLQRNHNALEEQMVVLELGKEMYRKTSATLAPGAGEEPAADRELMALSEFGGASSSVLGFIAGVVPTEVAPTLEKVLFRATRGNAVFQRAAVDKPLLDETKGGLAPVAKTFFMVFFTGGVLGDKASRIATHLGAKLYRFPDDAYGHAEMVFEVAKRLKESTQVLGRSRDILHGSLAAAAAHYGTWEHVVSREKMVHDALNKCEFDIKRSVFVAQGWVCDDDFEYVAAELAAAALAGGFNTRPILSSLKTRLTPPTHIPVNKFTSGFQALVNTYGTPRYREVNPGAFCCILFPFLFGIMFGDFGHGLLFALFGLYLISKEKEWEGQDLGDMLEMVYGGRYICFLNGLFGAFVGLLYNEAFAFPMGFFGESRWQGVGPDGKLTGETCTAEDAGGCQLAGPIYPVGIDPIWHYTANKITFFNSLKMKISIVVGVIQMSLGIFLSLLNHLEFRDVKKVVFQFIPEIVFFEGIFGYLVITVFMKWATDWSCDTPESLCEPAPSLLSMLISMFMSPTADITTPLYGHECFTSCAAAAAKCAVAAVAAACPQTCGVEGLEPAAYVDTLRPEIAGVQFETKLCFSELQASIQMKLLVGAFISVPILLLAIPLIEIYQHSGGKSYSTLSDAEETGGGHGEHGEEFSAGDAFIHQGIHTIEFVLGGISNTASYLRLWALSLAHSQLAELFKDMVLGGGLKAESMPPILHGLALFVAYGMWSIMSLVVLLAMENLSSFLHALRLQWVEFQNKFYYGDGVKFTPFSFANIGKAAED